MKRTQKRSPKTDLPRDIAINIRINPDELALLTKLCDKRKKVGSARWSRTDVIIDALKYSDGQIIF